LPFCEKEAGQKVQRWGFSPVCLTIWVCSTTFWLKALLQWLHLYGRSPGWERRENRRERGHKSIHLGGIDQWFPNCGSAELLKELSQVFNLLLNVVIVERTRCNFEIGYCIISFPVVMSVIAYFRELFIRHFNLN
jgi:hypothetical protein